MRRLIAPVATACALVILAITANTTAAHAASATPVCQQVSNQVTTTQITLAPGETITFSRDATCLFSGVPTEMFGIRAVGAQTGATPATIGTVEYSDDGTTWTVTSGINGYNPPLMVRYTAPTNGATSDSFYIYAGAVGSGNAGYVYNVSVYREVHMRDLTMWHQAYGRASSEDTCRVGYDPSWALWPNGGTGGWTCVREILAYGS